jgi:hypothetical protein
MLRAAAAVPKSTVAIQAITLKTLVTDVDEC